MKIVQTTPSGRFRRKPLVEEVAEVASGTHSIVDNRGGPLVTVNFRCGGYFVILTVDEIAAAVNFIKRCDTGGT